MEFSKIELIILNQIAQESLTLSEIQNNTNKSAKSITEGLKRLKLKDILVYDKNYITPQKTEITSLLLRNIIHNRDFPMLIEGIKLKILIELFEPKTVESIAQDLCIPKSTVYLHLRYLLRRSVIRRAAEKYSFTRDMWPDLTELLVELKRKDELIDERVPPGSKIYEKNRGSVLFEYGKLLDNAVLTAFSAYGTYGIPIETPFVYQRIPSETVTIAQVFLDSLMIAQKDTSVRFNLYLVLFYAKHKKKLKMVKHPLIENIFSALNGNSVSGFPRIEELMTKAELYDIKISKD
ncbi:MAG: hypothetical protein ABIA93_05265 [Candidatus Woesearchaeota archaeon]